MTVKIADTGGAGRCPGMFPWQLTFAKEGLLQLGGGGPCSPPPVAEGQEVGEGALESGQLALTSHLDA